MLPQIFTASRTAHLPSTKWVLPEVDTPYYAFVPEKIHPSTQRESCTPTGLQRIRSKESNSRIGLPVRRADPVRIRPRTRIRSRGSSL